MAATSTVTYDQLLRQVRSRKGLAPVYLLHGEEGYYTDRLVEAFENLLTEEERDFNLYQLYGAQTTPEQVAEACRRYPMMADRVVVILKEAQAMNANVIDRLAPYVANPNKEAVLVIAFRGVTAKGKNLMDRVRKTGAVVFESQKLRDETVGPIIQSLIKERGLNIEQKGLLMLREFIGTDVARLYNEIDKLAMILGPGAMVTPEAIERNIGVSKDYNSDELIRALAERDKVKAYKIVKYFRANVKNNPLPMVVGYLYNYFSNLISMQFSADRTPGGYARACGFKSPYAVRSYESALRNYNARQTMEIIAALREFDCRSKGNGSRWNAFDLFQDLVTHILNARGDIVI